MNFADRTQQQDLLRLALAQGSKVIVMDNIGCLFTGVNEDGITGMGEGQTMAPGYAPTSDFASSDSSYGL